MYRLSRIAQRSLFTMALVPFLATIAFAAPTNIGANDVDTTAPTTAITATGAGGTLRGTVTVTAVAYDNVAVTKIECGGQERDRASERAGGP